MSVVSMTGFGKGEDGGEGALYTVEVKTVNHRYFDYSCRLPALCSSMEPEIVRIVREYVKRGRAEIIVIRRGEVNSGYELQFNQALLAEYMQTVLKGAQSYLKDTQTAAGQFVLNAFQRREILDFVSKQNEEKDEFQFVEKALRQALTECSAMRVKEGVALEKEILQQLDFAASIVKTLQPKAEYSVQAYRTRLGSKLEKSLAPAEIDSLRIAQEVAILAERIDISEELTRLDSHIVQFRDFLKDTGTGRKLDFLLQEMGREINTIGSKSQSSEISAAVVEVKSILEKIREQVQNIE